MCGEKYILKAEPIFFLFFPSKENWSRNILSIDEKYNFDEEKVEPGLWKIGHKIKNFENFQKKIRDSQNLFWSILSPSVHIFHI